MIALASLAIVCAGSAGVGWYYSDQILLQGKGSTLREQRVHAAGPGWVRLSRDRESLQAGTWALQWEDGYGWVGPVLSAGDSGVEREFRPVVGEPPVGGWAALRGVSRAADPRTLLGIAFADVAYDGPLGSYAAWLIPGGDSTWVIYVHGRGANRSEALRTVGALARRNMPGLLVTYRNDVGAPPSPDGFSHLGLTEWEDVEAAARHALAEGARGLVLFGYSMGGQIVMQFMSRSPLAAHVSGVVLESPLLDWNATLDHRARALRVPAWVAGLGKRAASLRAGLDWGQLDRVAHAGGITTPILLFHGIHDSFAPVSSSEALARALPHNVTLIRIEAGNHVEAWNVDSTRYIATLDSWLTSHAAGRVRR